MLFGQPSALGYAASDFAVSEMLEEFIKGVAGSRRNQSRAMRMIIANKFDDMVTDSLKRRYDPKTFKKLKLEQGVSTMHNILVDVVGTLAVGFSEGLKCSLNVGGQPIESEEFKQQMEAYRYPDRMKEIDFKQMCHGRLYMMPVIAHSRRTNERMFTHNVLTPENFDLIPDPNNPLDWYKLLIFDQVWTRNERTGALTLTNRCLMWEVDHWEMWLESNRHGRQKWQRADEGINPYGFIPGESYTTSTENVLWPEPEAFRLAEATIDVNAWQSYQKILATGYLKVLAGQFDETLPPGQRLIHSHALQMGKVENPNVMDFTTDIATFNEAMVERTKSQMATSYGLYADQFKRLTSPESGTAIKLRMVDRDRIALARRLILKRPLPKQYRGDTWMTHVELSRAGGDGKIQTPIEGMVALPPLVPPFRMDGYDIKTAPVLVADPKELYYPEMEAERQQREDYEEKKGFASRVDHAMERNPDLSREEAIVQLRAKLAEEALFSNAASNRIAGFALTVDKPEAEADAPAEDEETPLDQEE